MRSALKLVGLCLLAFCAFAQEPDFSLQARHANVIAAAKVIAVEPPTFHRNTYLIRVSVEDPLLGVQHGEQLVIVEWAGLWEPGYERYRVGETYLFFLRGSASSARVVAGEAGRLKIEKDNTVIVPQSNDRAKRLQSSTQTRLPYREVAAAAKSALSEAR